MALESAHVPIPHAMGNHASIGAPEGSGEVDDGDQLGSEAAKITDGSGKKKSGRRPRRKKTQMPTSPPEQVQGRQKQQSSPNHISSQQQQQQQQQRKQKQKIPHPQNEQQKHASATNARPKAAPRPGPSAAADINKSLSVAMMASPLFPLPFPLMPVLGVTLLASQGRSSGQKNKGDNVDMKPRNG